MQADRSSKPARTVGAASWVSLGLAATLGAYAAWQLGASHAGMVTIGTTTPDEAREVIEISLSVLNHEIPDFELQKTRSKKSIEMVASKN